MKSWQFGYSHPTRINQHNTQQIKSYTTYPLNPNTPINYGVRTPYFKNGPTNHGYPYGANVYPTVASHITEGEYVQSLLSELDQLKEEARKCKEAEAARLAELAQELADLREETRKFEERMAIEEEDAIEEQTEQMVIPQVSPPAYVIKLPGPQPGTWTLVTPDMLSAETVDEDELEESDEEEEFDVMRFCPIPFDDSINSESDAEERIDTTENECGGRIACEGLSVP